MRRVGAGASDVFGFANGAANVADYSHICAARPSRGPEAKA